LAEGSVGNYNARPLEQINFSLNFNEKEIADDIEAMARRLGSTVCWHSVRPEAGSRTVSVVSKKLATMCLQWCGAGAVTKQLSREVLFAPTSTLLPLLGAYLNGDGGTYEGSAYFSTSSEQLSHQLFIALARCGIIASVNKIDHHPSEKSLVRHDTVEYQVWVGTDFSWMLGPHTLKPVRRSLKHRGQRFFYVKDGVTYLMSPIMEISEDAYCADVFNFSVEEEESYVAEGLAVHNSKVPFDTSSITLDWDAYNKAKATYDPKRHKSPGQAILEVHKKTPIKGVSITRDDYDEYCLKYMNRILPDGRKVFVYNDYPRFFDISFVFIGADRTAKVMVYIARSGSIESEPSTKVAAALGYTEDVFEKAASVKDAKDKSAEMDKEVLPVPEAAKAIPLMTKNEQDLPRDMLNALSAVPLANALSTVSGMGMVLRPREFQRIILVQSGNAPMADALENKGVTFPQVGESAPCPLSPDSFMPALARLLMPMFEQRTALAPAVERRVTVICASPEEDVKPPSSHSSDLLRKIGAAYNGYRDKVLDIAPHCQNLLQKTATARDYDLVKVAAADPSDTFTPLSYCYLRDAFKNEIVCEDIGQGATTN
jgi:hypothetical protein